MFIWDPAKEASNIAKHGLSFSAAYAFEAETAIMVDRTRMTDGEVRFALIGILYGRLHTLIYTVRDQDIRVISLRRANVKEEKLYEKNT